MMFPERARAEHSRGNTRSRPRDELDAAGEAVDALAFVRHHLVEVHRDVAAVDAVHLEVARRLLVEVAAVEQRLRRDAADLRWGVARRARGRRRARADADARV